MWNWIKKNVLNNLTAKTRPPVSENLSPVSASTHEKKDSYQELSKYLAVRIYPTHQKMNYPEDLFYTQNFLDDLMLLLVLDYPSSIEPVLRSNTEEWNITAELLFEKAIQNLQENYLRTIETCTKFSTNGALTLTGEDIFKTSTLLYLEEYPALQGAHGSLIIFPEKHTLCAWLIHDDISLEIGFQQIIPFLEQLHLPDEELLSKKIYWYFNGQYNSIPYVVGLNGIKYVLPFDLENKVY